MSLPVIRVMRTLFPVVAIAAVVLASGCHERSQSAPAASQTALPASPAPVVTAAPAAPPYADPEAEKAIAEQHAAPVSAACLAKKAEPAKRPALAIHRWVDAAGVTHYSDQSPSGAVSQHRVLEVGGLEPIRIEASGYDGNLPSDLQRRAIVDALAVQRVFHDAFGIDGPADLVLRIVFVGDKAAYARLVGSGVLAASTGAYVPQRRTIYVRRQADDELAFAILRHEIAHALIHELIGNLPVVLNEGLAEYFRHYRAAGMGGQIDLAADRRSLAGAAPTANGADDLVELLALSGQDFYTADRDRRYLRAYALVAVLMRDPGAIAAMREVLLRQQEQPCAPVAAERVLDGRYPGGLGTLAADWAAFLRDPPDSVRAY
jgi:hypothetical protein